MAHDRLSPEGDGEVRRTFKVPSLVHAADAIAVEKALAEVPGVRQLAVDVARHRVTVRYEIRETDFQSLESVLEGVGFPPADGRWARLRSNWLQNLDLTGRENAHAPPAACCNKPPVRRH